MLRIKNLKGVIDSHVHIGVGQPPVDGFLKRGLNLISLAKLAKKTGVTFLPKMHFNGLIEPIWEKEKVLVSPSLTFNSQTNGFNPAFVRKAAEKVQPARLAIFFPSLEAETHLINIDKAWFSIFQPTFRASTEYKKRFERYKEFWKQKKGIKVLDKNGHLLSEVKEVIRAVGETGSFLHTSHLGEKEVKEVVKEAVKQKTEVVITHANARANKIKLKTLVNLLNLAVNKKAKVWVEFCAANWIVGLKGAYDLQKSFVDWMRTLGVENCILSSDANGLEPDRENKKTNALDIPKEVPLNTPLDWLEYFVNLLMEQGINQKEIYQMIVKNPGYLLKGRS